MERRSLQTTLGEVVREKRLAAGLSQERLAEAANLHRNYIGLVERGVNAPSVTALDSMARALGCNASDLLRVVEQRLETRL